MKYYFSACLGSALLIIGDVFATRLTIVTEHLAPFQIVDKTSISGLSTEIVEATLRASPYQYTIDVHPWSLAFKRAVQEHNTCIYSLARLPIRETQFQWIGHIASATSSFYSLKRRKDIPLASVEDAKKFRTAVIQDDVTHQFLLSKGFEENSNLYATSNYDSLLTLLEVPSRNIDLVIINDDLIRYRLKRSEEIQQYQNLLEIDELQLDFHLACSIDTDRDIVETLSASMQDLEQNGTLPNIRNNWRSKLVEQP
ncbi:MAG: ABC transporter substrate-binding protein [Paraglaciecola sp.]|uniref:substrate-binding periplasmic protein n=1 Tax=Paraglaciecola sp. TaxID=1920173 RepID=UPI00273F7EBD|nr:ABC transporter substrate-binding protein [Paraglaciecola sp.]MDP5030162.1 ABC transporter substrate-binding protein [Paraglaciecola sp.]MDP5130425.1 ABC transporter substrate-binding protein [Paraglaciecola sp.]